MSPKVREGLKKGARAIIVALTIFSLFLIILAMGFGDRFLFFPAKYPEGSWDWPRTAPDPVEDVTFTAADGVKLHAWFSRPKEAKAAILFAHGNGGNITHRIDQLQQFREIPAAVFMFDYRGYGRSEGSPDEQGLYADARAGYDWLTAHGFPPERIIVYGESLGGGVAVDLASKVPVGGLVLQCTFTSVAAMARRVVPIFPMGWFMASKFDSLGKIGSIRCPKLHFHGRADEIVPFELGRALFDAAAEPKRWVEYPEMTHNEWPGRRTTEWLAELKRFVSEVAK